MSGSAGGNRVQRDDVSKIVAHYKHYILDKYEYAKECVITGSYNCSDKPDFGDIDLIVYLNSPHKYMPQIKQAFADFLNTFSDEIIVPFKSEKYKGKKYLNTGEIITVLYHNPWHKGEFVQIDNIIACSPEELEFKNKFLSIPAIKQGLMLGLIKCAILEVVS